MKIPSWPDVLRRLPRLEEPNVFTVLVAGLDGLLGAIRAVGRGIRDYGK